MQLFPLDRSISTLLSTCPEPNDKPLNLKGHLAAAETDILIKAKQAKGE